MNEGRAVSPGRLVSFLGAACVVLTAFNARPLFTSAGAVLPDMIATLRLSGDQASVLTALPIVCMGLFAPAAGRFGRRLGVERALLCGIALLCVAIVLRSLGPRGLVFAGTALAGLAIAIVNVLLPVIVKRRFADRAALFTSLYTTGIGAGAAAGAALTVPVAGALGVGWREALLCWLAPALLALGALAGLLLADRERSPRPPPRRQGLWSNGIALRMTLFFGLHSGLAYTVFGWLAPMLVARGMDPSAAGYVVALTIAGQMAGTILAPHAAAMAADQRFLNVGLALGSALLLAGLFVLPLRFASLVGPFQGLFQGSLLAVSMMLIILRSSTPDVAAGVSALVQSAGMVGAGTTPFLVGLLYEWTGTLAGPATLVLAVGLGAAMLGYAAGLPGTIVLAEASGAMPFGPIDQRGDGR